MASGSCVVVHAQDHKRVAEALITKLQPHMKAVDDMVSKMKAIEPELITRPTMTLCYQVSQTFAKAKTLKHTISGIDKALNEMRSKSSRAERAACYREYLL